MTYICISRLMYLINFRPGSTVEIYVELRIGRRGWHVGEAPDL